ncbi:MAG: B12-binding domain-containing radical SAM protein, partial [Candidatus Helarchaeota archaeon]
EFCREVRRRKLDLTFACPNGIRIDTLDRELLTVMRRTGFYSLTFAIESGSQTILNRVNKNLDLSVVPKRFKLAKKLGYIIPSYFIFGLPGETYETARRTIQFAKSLPFDHPLFFLARPLPGSKFFDEWIREKKIREDDYYNLFHFYTFREKLELTSEDKTIILPKDAIREFYLRPIQIWRGIKKNIEVFHLRQLLLKIINYLKTIF